MIFHQTGRDLCRCGPRVVASTGSPPLRPFADLVLTADLVLAVLVALAAGVRPAAPRGPRDHRDRRRGRPRRPARRARATRRRRSTCRAHADLVLAVIAAAAVLAGVLLVRGPRARRHRRRDRPRRPTRRARAARRRRSTLPRPRGRRTARSPASPPLVTPSARDRLSRVEDQAVDRGSSSKLCQASLSRVRIAVGARGSAPSWSARAMVRRGARGTSSRILAARTKIENQVIGAPMSSWSTPAPPPRADHPLQLRHVGCRGREPGAARAVGEKRTTRTVQDHSRDSPKGM